MIARLLLLVFAVAATQSPPPVPAGKLCVDGAPCVATEGAEARVVAATTARRFIWTSTDQTIVAIGSIAPEQTLVKLADGTSRTIRLSPLVRADVEFAIAAKANRWQWTIKDPPPLIRILHPVCADCLLKVDAEGFRPFEKPLRSVRDVTLLPWPRIEGRVVDGTTNVPLAGATLTVSEVLLGKSDANGTFALSMNEKWPHAVDVAYPGRAPRRILLRRTPGNDDLGDIKLTTGGALRVTIDSPMPQKLQWELRDPLNGDLLRRGTLDAAATELFIDLLGAGSHAFIVRGSGPLQQFGNKVKIDDGTVATTTISIDPATVNLEVTRASKAVTGIVEVDGGTGTWSGEVTLDEKGNATEELWQRGRLYASLRSPRFVTGTRVESDEVTWRIEVADRTIAGRVVDAATNAPLPHVTVILSPATSDAAIFMSVQTDADGRFTFDAMKPGTHAITARADGYETVESLPVTIPEESGTYPQEIRMESLARDGRTLALTDERNAPIDNAVVFLGDREGLREIGATGIDGRCPVPLPPDESGVLFVIPRSGSFAFNRIAPQRGDEDVISMRVRSGSAAIEVTARDKDGKPVPNILLVPRINGMMLPPEVLSALRNYQGTSFSTDATGMARITRVPPGVYELWAVAGQDQMRAVRSGSPPPPAASLEVETGRYSVALELAAR